MTVGPGRRTRWLVLAGAILALQAPALDFLSLKLPNQGLVPSALGGAITWIQWTMTPPLAAYFATALVPLGMAFGRVRENPAGRLASLILFFVVALFWMVEGILFPGGVRTVPFVFSVLIGGAGAINVLGQLCAGLGFRVAAGTARVWLGVLLFWVTLVSWIAWSFNPWLLGTYAGLAGGTMIALGEWKDLCEPASVSS